MKLQAVDIMDGIRCFREGDRIIVDNDFSMNASVYRRSEKNKPYLSFGVDGNFQLTLIEIILIVSAVSAAVTLFMVSLHRRIAGLFRRRTKKD